MINATFVMEQHIGHRTFYQNLRRFIEPSPELNSSWVKVTYYTKPGYIWERLPVLPAGIRGTLTGRMQARKGLQQQPCDVAVFNTQVPAALAGGLLQKQPYVICTDITPIQYDGMGEHYGHQPDRDGLISRYKHWANVKLLRNAARILPWSNWVRESLIADYGVDRNQIEVVSPGVDTEVWHPGARRTEKSPLRILFVGSALYRKGGQLLLEAFQTLPSGLAELILVTRTQLLPSEGVTIYHNMQPNSPELIALYQSCDLFVLPTQAEAFGIAAVEASAIGLPVIATDVGGLSDVVVHGKTGFLIQPNDKQALVTHLHQLAQNPDLRKRLGQAARKRVQTRFDAKKNAQRVLQIIHEVARDFSRGTEREASHRF